MDHSQSDYHSRPHESSVIWIMHWIAAGRQFEACPGKHEKSMFMTHAFTQIFGSATARRHRGVVSSRNCVLSMPFGRRQWQHSGVGSDKLNE